MELSIFGSLVEFRLANYFDSNSGGLQPITGGLGASLICTIKNIDGTSFSADCENMVMALVPNTLSDWWCIVPNSVQFLDQVLYRLDISVTVSGSTVIFRDKFRASYPKGSATPD